MIRAGGPTASAKFPQPAGGGAARVAAYFFLSRPQLMKQDMRRQRVVDLKLRCRPIVIG
jgi:hypothetical protein